MGAVYEAWDRVLEVAVAIKVIRAKPTSNAEARETVERRFKREIQLARQVTHKHVVRIHDLGEVDGITYITMPYVQGSDLATILKRDERLPVDRVVAIARQVASGLAAAHEAGIVHRDLKPANIMIAANGDALIMDFGIARSTADGMTMTAGGPLVGTINYMAPEQARGGNVDQRADIYAFGLILKDLLVGRRHGGGDPMLELMERMRLAPTSMRSVDSTIPEPLDALVTKCLQPDPAARYQTVEELVTDLHRLGPNGEPRPPSSDALLNVKTPHFLPLRWRWIAAVVLVLGLATTAWLMRDRSVGGRSSPGASRPLVSITIVPFRNASTGQASDSLGSVLTQLLGTALGRSASLRTVSMERVYEVVRDLGIAPTATIGPLELARIADFSSARRVLSGSYARSGASIRIEATLQDLDQARSVPLAVTALTERGLPAAISELAAAVRRDLGRASPDLMQELDATSWQPSTSSFEALRLYCEGKQLLLQGSYREAQKKFEEATRLDGKFTLALSALGRTHATLGDDNQAQQFSLLAMSLSETLRPQEKFVVHVNHYRILRDQEKTVESYERLLDALPNSESIEFEVGSLYEQSRKLDLAKAHLARAVELDRKFVGALVALGRVEIRGGNALGSFAHLNEALTVVTQLNNNVARASILQAMGVQYKQLNLPGEALKHYQQSLEIKRGLGDRRGMAASLNEIAQVYEMLGRREEAQRTLQEAITLQRKIGDRAGLSTNLTNLGALLNELGRSDDALPLLREALQFRRETGNPLGEALILNNIGTVYLNKGEFSDAQTYFEQSLEIREKTKASGTDIGDALHNLGETLVKIGRYDEALTKYGRALELRRAGDKRGAAIESYAMGTVFDYQGRYGAAIKSKAEALQVFRELKLRDQWLAEILSGYGHSLSVSGRLDDAVAPLNEAMTLAKELQLPPLIGQIVRLQAERLYYRGEPASPTEQAQAASRAWDRRWSLEDRFHGARIAVTLNPTPTLGSTLAALAKEASALGRWPLAVESWTRGAATWLKIGDRQAALQEAQRAIAKAETLGLRVLLAEAHYVFAEVLRLGADPQAGSEYGRALQLLDQIKGEDGNQNILKRADLALIHSECTRWSK
jgi:serine/threonine protein kinase/tetratricopeptide (TPR) repeat protein